MSVLTIQIEGLDYYFSNVMKVSSMNVLIITDSSQREILFRIEKSKEDFKWSYEGTFINDKYHSSGLKILFGGDALLDNQLVLIFSPAGF